MVHGKFCENLFSFRSEVNADLPAIDAVALPLYEPAPHRSVHQFDGTVMSYLQPFRKDTNGRFCARRQTANGEQELVLLRVNAGSLRGLLAEAQKPAYLIPELSQSAIVDCSPLLCHGSEYSTR